MDNAGKPLAVFYTGTNGAGKSSLRSINSFPGLKTIDPDAIARTINPDDPRSVDVQAGREAIRQFRETIAQRQSFSMETTLTGRSVLDRRKKAKEAGFTVRLYYVGLSSVELNIERVASRVAKGGHHIDEADIRRRYTESLGNLPRAMELADSGAIYSNDGLEHEEQYKFLNGVLNQVAQHPVQWAQDAVKAQSRHTPPQYEYIKQRLETALEQQRSRISEPAWRQTRGLAPDDRVHGAKMDAGHVGELQTHEQRRGIPQGSSQAPVLTAAATDENIVEAAEAVQSEQQAMLDGASVAQAYEVTLANYVEAKHNQVARLEGRLENLIEQQEARVQQTQANAPGMFSLPGTKRAWQAKTMREQARLQTLRNRLEAVREIRDGMSLRVPRIEELATRKMRAENPQLASSWDAMREEQRRLESEEQKRVLKAREEQRQTQVQSQTQTHGRGRTLSLSRRPD